MQFQSKEKIATYVESAEKCEIHWSVSDYGGKFSVCVSVPRMNKMTENVNKAIAWMKCQINYEHLDKLHLISIKWYMMKKQS